jgi:hypothetical protein
MKHLEYTRNPIYAALTIRDRAAVSTDGDTIPPIATNIASAATFPFEKNTKMPFTTNCPPP